MKKKTCNNIRMGSELRAFTKINNIINDFIVEKAVEEGVKILKGLDQEQAEQLTEYLFTQPKFRNALEDFEFRAEKSFLTDGVAALKDGLAFIPEVGALVDIGIDAATKLLPQAIFLLEDGLTLKDAMQVLSNQQELVDQAHNNLMNQNYQNQNYQNYQNQTGQNQNQNYQNLSNVGGRRRKTRGRRRGRTRRPQKSKQKSRRRLKK